MILFDVVINSITADSSRFICPNPNALSHSGQVVKVISSRPSSLVRCEGAKPNSVIN
ncbi:hypothetical protein Hanom_Chr12g01096291 [Helianthus anomalus]